MPKSYVPPFLRMPAHVDGSTLYGAAQRLEAKLYAAMPKIETILSNLHPDHSQAEVPELGDRLPEEYWRDWFRTKADNFLSYLQIYAYIISMAIPDSKAEFASIRLLDFGGGGGLMSMLAKEAGIGHVTYLDIDPGTISATKVVSEAVGLPLDGYICGSEKVLLAGESNRFDSVVSSDVLEHVYDVDSVFKAIGHACSPGGFVFLHTGANPKSPYQRYKLMRLHRSFEPEDTKQLSKLHASVRLAIWEERKEFIQSYAADITAPDLDRLAKSSRGLDRTGLQRAIDVYLDSKRFPVPSHPTNTCKLSGYWLERLMDPYEVARKMTDHGFRTRLTRTFWGPGRSTFVRRFIKHGLNFASGLSTRISMRLSFYYGVHGIKQ